MPLHQSITENSQKSKRNYHFCGINAFFFQKFYNIIVSVYSMGNIRDKPETNKRTQFIKTSKINYALSSMCGWRTFMEDAHLAITPFNDDQNMALFAVFDGHGGCQCAIFAKNHFPKCLQENANFITQNYPEALTETFLQIDALMLTEAGKKQLKKIRSENAKKENGNDYEGDTIGGTTSNVCLITKEDVYCANVGDSRAIGICRQSKINKIKIKQLSYDHKPENEIEKKRIMNAGGTVNKEGRINDNLNLSRALGDFTYKCNKDLPVQKQMIIAVPDIVKVKRRELSYILMGCDGIWERKANNVMGKWVMKKVQKGINLKGIAQSLLDEELGSNPEQQLGMDNMTVVLIQIF